MLDPVMNAVVKVFCMHSEPSYSQPWQRESQYSSTSSGFALPGQMLLTNAHSVECHSRVRVSVAPGRERRGPGVLGVLDGPGRVGEPVFQLVDPDLEPGQAPGQARPQKAWRYGQVSGARATA